MVLGTRLAESLVERGPPMQRKSVRRCTTYNVPVATKSDPPEPQELAQASLFQHSALLSYAREPGIQPRRIGDTIEKVANLDKR